MKINNMTIVATGLPEAERQTFQAIASAVGKTPARLGEDLIAALPERTLSIHSPKWESTLMIVVPAAEGIIKVIAPDSAEAIETVPLKTFVEAYRNNEDAWLTCSKHEVTAEVAAGFMQALSLVALNHSTRNNLLSKLNATLQKSVEIDGLSMIIKTTTSEYSGLQLSPMSKRDLSGQILRLEGFLRKNPGGFSVY
jgi:hypothetical protein